MKTPITLEGKTVFVTGSAGFIGANLVKRLLAVPRIRIIGIDNMNDYYDVSLKEYRLQELEKAAALVEGSEYHSSMEILQTRPALKIFSAPGTRTSW